ncbi:hypothetical protein PhCBS80983_g02948 [Powellomyces hirtus]|uniref:Uncharacterized protein n=1 Tax=Powellomyces hirtus TaxID=109895 RepID=A0A507E3N8_9FUNG|nr:hypothetical protein PhCBS80983_g02948 [Powellomyces hirtus]
MNTDTLSSEEAPKKHEKDPFDSAGIVLQSNLGTMTAEKVLAEDGVVKTDHAVDAVVPEGPTDVTMTAGSTKLPPSLSDKEETFENKPEAAHYLPAADVAPISLADTVSPPSRTAPDQFVPAGDEQSDGAGLIQLLMEDLARDKIFAQASDIEVEYTEYSSRDVHFDEHEAQAAEPTTEKSLLITSATGIDLPKHPEQSANESASLSAAIPPGPSPKTNQSLLPQHISRQKESRFASAELDANIARAPETVSPSRATTARTSKAGSRQTSGRKHPPRTLGTPMTIFTKKGLSFEVRPDRRPGLVDDMRAVLASNTNRGDESQGGIPLKGPELPSIDCRPPPSWFRKRYPATQQKLRTSYENFSVYSQPLPLARANSAPVQSTIQRHQLLRELRTRRDTALSEDYLGFPGVSPQAFTHHITALQKNGRFDSPFCQALAPTVNIFHPCHQTFSLLGKIHWQEEDRNLPRCHSPQYWKAAKHKPAAVSPSNNTQPHQLRAPSLRDLVPTIRQAKSVFPHQQRRVTQSKYVIPPDNV